MKTIICTAIGAAIAIIGLKIIDATIVVIAAHQITKEVKKK